MVCLGECVQEAHVSCKAEADSYPHAAALTRLPEKEAKNTVRRIAFSEEDLPLQHSACGSLWPSKLEVADPTTLTVGCFRGL
jgi:hypothetical protein